MAVLSPWASSSSLTKPWNNNEDKPIRTFPTLIKSRETAELEISGLQIGPGGEVGAGRRNAGFIHIKRAIGKKYICRRYEEINKKWELLKLYCTDLLVLHLE